MPITVDWQSIALALISALCSIVWWEVRGLRKAKHQTAQVMQWCVFAIEILSKKLDIDLPVIKLDE